MEKSEYSKNWETLFAKYHSLTAKEFSVLSGNPRAESEQMLNDLTVGGKRKKLTTKNGSIWELKKVKKINERSMKWTYTIKNKFLASIALLSLCVLVLLSNFIDRNHTEKVKKSIGTLYEDRLIAEVYILKMTRNLYQIKELVNVDSSHRTNTSSINDLLLTTKTVSNLYHKTKFTESEIIKAQQLENIIQNLGNEPFANYQQELIALDKALGLLDELSAIQLEESKQIMKKSEALYRIGKSSSQFVFALIIIILLVLQAIVFSSKSLTSNIKKSSPQLN